MSVTQDERTEAILARFEREYYDTNSITEGRRLQQNSTLRQLTAQMRRPLDEITAEDMAVYVGSLLKRGLKPTTALKEMNMVRGFVFWANEAGLIDDARSDRLKLVRSPRGSGGRSKPRPYTAAQIHELHAIVSAKYPPMPSVGKGSHLLKFHLQGQGTNTGLRRQLWRHGRRLQYEAIIALALEQGLRRIEILNMSIPALHYDNDQIVVKSAKQQPGREKVRAVPYTQHARTCVQEWLDFRTVLRPDHDSPWVMMTRQGDTHRQLEPMSFRQMRDFLKPFGPGWCLHRLRHTAATEWLRAGVPLEKLRVYMGHSSLETTLMYAELLKGDIDEAFEAAEAAFAARLKLA
jgi:site-specific recombinase XerD